MDEVNKRIIAHSIMAAATDPEESYVHIIQDILRKYWQEDTEKSKRYGIYRAIARARMVKDAG